MDSINELIVFYVIHSTFKDVFIKGVLDMDFFEEPNQLQYIHADGERKTTIPANPYEKNSIEWKAYNELLSCFKPNDEFIELLSECVSCETHKYEKYTIEMESLTW